MKIYKKYIDTIKIGKYTFKPKVNVYYVDNIMSDEKIAKKEGDYINSSFYKKHNGILINENADVYRKDNGKLLLKIRKNVIPKELTKKPIESFVKTAQTLTNNRGASSGKLDKKKIPEYIFKNVNNSLLKKKFRANIKFKNKQNQDATHSVTNYALSNIIGYYDKPERANMKGPQCRLTAFNKNKIKEWKNALPFIKHVNKLFKHLTPKKYAKQLRRANKVPKFKIKGTAFSTLTINYSWRTALHRDRGDFLDGFGNLVVCEDFNNPNEYTGCYTGFPQFGIAVDVRDGDYLAMDVHEWHCNTEFKKKGKTKKLLKKTERDRIINANGWNFNRLSLVHYLRENMIKCKE